MKTIELSEASRPLSDYAEELDEEIIVLTSKKKPVAALVSLKDVDRESLALSTVRSLWPLLKRPGKNSGLVRSCRLRK